MDTDTTVRGTLYHLPATAARGDAILPLRQLRDRHPDLYARHSRKYAERPEVLQQRIEPLDCAWADVVFLSPMHPAPLFAALSRSVGAGTLPAPPWSLDAGRLVPPARLTVRAAGRGPLTGPSAHAARAPPRPGPARP
ncbi:MAG TPA: hypothetical protein VGM10_00955 [Actinocrinis sp.]|jgi:hypothetical protein